MHVGRAEEDFQGQAAGSEIFAFQFAIVKGCMLLPDLCQLVWRKVDIFCFGHSWAGVTELSARQVLKE